MTPPSLLKNGNGRPGPVSKVSKPRRRGSLVTDLQTAAREFHRAFFAIRPVVLHEMPTWWSKRVCWATRGWGEHDAFQGMQALAPHGSVWLFDHWGSSVDEAGRSVFVSEPYASIKDPQTLEWAATVALTLGVHVRVLPAWQSWWYPGETIRIEFAECPRDPVCQGCKTREQVKAEGRERKRKQRRGAYVG